MLHEWCFFSPRFYRTSLNLDQTCLFMIKHMKVAFENLQTESKNIHLNYKQKQKLFINL